MNINLLDFNVSLGRQKPRTIINPGRQCPFCDIDSLTGIIDTEDDMILLKNKYNVLEPSDQYVLIESSRCDADIPDYSPEKMYKLIRFGLKHWLAMIASEEYEGVLFFKNNGPLSGGTISHPHMQIIGLPEVNPELFSMPEEFEGISVRSEKDIHLNVSTCPRIGFTEINITCNTEAFIMDEEQIRILASYIQNSIIFIKDYFSSMTHHSSISYNIFFYLCNDMIRVKMMPRFPTSPLYIGYGLHLKPSNIDEIAKKLGELF
ncbi:MAG: DUF4931 domain-containing protein [Selenomonadales bacterium]|nr:DUF4931 domain-containing protein [Selenomonadales bacterium]